MSTTLLIFVIALIFFIPLVAFLSLRHRHEAWNTPPEEFRVNYKTGQDKYGQDLEGK
jgi:hypothetical protein